MRLWPLAADAPAADGSPAQRTADAVLAHCRAVIAAAGPACVAAKPQLACFERLGAPGIAALVAVLAAAREAGLIVIADGKRGDVPVTAAAYAQALAGETASPNGAIAGLGADAFTANPLLGIDSLEPLIATGAGVFVVVRSSNPGAADLQDLELAAGGVLWEQIARIVDELGTPRACGLADVGAVFGATVPAHLGRARELMPKAIFLLPGVGAQGGRVEDLAPAFAAGRAAGLVSASRSIVEATDATGERGAAAARAEAERLRELAWSLS
jgi:orotidine-5'-phosphate decarboxylase